MRERPDGQGSTQGDAAPASPLLPARLKGERLRTVLSWGIASVIHLLVLVLLANVGLFGGPVGSGAEGEKVSLLAEDDGRSLQAPKGDEADLPEVHTPLELPPTPLVSAAEQPLVLVPPVETPPPPVKAAGAAEMDPNRKEWGDLATTGGPGGGSLSDESWAGLIRGLRRHGLDIVLAFDSTGSMAEEITEVKAQIARISMTLLRLVPKTRISICTYRDRGDEYVVRGIPLTGDVKRVEQYLAGISAGGGGDTPEAVVAGLRWAVTQNGFRRRARKVVLLFGDAPPHKQDVRRCVEAAAAFRRTQGGIVSTVTCGGRPLPEFVRIAEAGIKER